MKYIGIWLVRFYRKFISPLKGKPCCRFYPTCSAYSIEAFTRRGFIVGLILTIARICRCQPLCPGGYDPVPLRGLTHPTNSLGEKVFYTIPDRDRFIFKYQLTVDNDKVQNTNRED